MVSGDATLVPAPKPAAQAAGTLHAVHGDPFKPDPARLRAERESVVAEYLPLKEWYADPAFLLGSVFDLQRHFPLTAELLRAHGLSAGDVLRSMHERRITALEAAVQLSPERFGAVRSGDRRGFATHGAAYATSSDYERFAALQSGMAVALLRRGVPASVVAKLIAEGKQQFTLWHRPDRTVEFNRSIRPGNVNPTWLLSDPESAGTKPEYQAAVRRILDLMVSDPSLPRFQLMDRSVLSLGLKDFEHFIAGVDRADAWVKDGERIRNPQWVAERLAAAIEHPGRYEMPVLPLSVIRIPLNTPYGTGGAIYIREIAPDAARIGPTDAMAMPSGARFVDVLLDQGTAALHSSGVPMREFVSGEAHRRLDALTSVDDSRTELKELAGAWWDLSVTAGGQMAGGAGTNHILVAAKYEQLTGEALPPLAVPADLLAVSTTRDRFIASFLGGDLFRSADAADAVETTQASTVRAEPQSPSNEVQRQLQIEQMRNQRAQQAEQYGDRAQPPQQQQAGESPEQQRRNDIQRRLQRLAVEAPKAHQMLVWMCSDDKRDGWAAQRHFGLSSGTYLQYVNAINAYLGTNGASKAVALAKPLVPSSTDALTDLDTESAVTTQHLAPQGDADRGSIGSDFDYANRLLPAGVFRTLNEDEATLVGLIAREAVESGQVLVGKLLKEALRGKGVHASDAARCIRSALDKLGACVDLNHQPGAASRALLHRLHQIGSDTFRDQLEMALGAPTLAEFGRYAERATKSDRRARKLANEPSVPPIMDTTEVGKPTRASEVESAAPLPAAQSARTQERTAQADPDRAPVASSLEYARGVLRRNARGLLNVEEAALVGLVAREAANSGKVLSGKRLDAALWGEGAHASDTSRCIRLALDKLGARVDLDRQGPEAASRALLHRLHQIGNDDFRAQLETALGASKLAEFGRYAERAKQFDRRIEAIEEFAPRLAQKLRMSSSVPSTRLIQAEMLLEIHRWRTRTGRLPTESELLAQLRATSVDGLNPSILGRLDKPRLDKLIDNLLEALDVPYDPASRNGSELASAVKIRNIAAQFSEH